MAQVNIKQIIPKSNASVVGGLLFLFVLLTACGQSVSPSSNSDVKSTPTASTEIEASTPIATQVAPSPTPEEPTVTPLTTETRLGLAAFGSVQIGMTIAQAEAATGMTFQQEASGGEEYGCLYYSVTGLADVALMVTDGAIARIDINNPQIRTRSGIKIGDREAQIREQYPGQIEAEPHEYVPDGKYLLFVPQDADSQNYRVLFETDAEGKVTAIRNGKLPEVGYIEGCV